MKLSIITLLCFFSFTGISQSNIECEDCIYSVEVREKLKELYHKKADSFYKCYYQDEYTSLAWASVTYLEIYSGRQDQFKSHLRAGVNIDSLKAWYRELTITENVLAIKYDYTGYNGQRKSNIITYNSLNTEEFDLDQNEENTFAIGSTYKKRQQGTNAIILPNKWHVQALNQTCNSLINYVDCMISNCTQIYDYLDSDSRSVNNNVYDPLFDYIDVLVPKPVYEQQKGYTNDLYSKARAQRNTRKKKAYIEQRKRTIQQSSKEDLQFKKLYQQAIDIWQLDAIGSEKLENIVEQVGDIELALQMKRKRRVVGYCSMDNGPANHLKSIATLSALAADWDLFIKTHMHLINDRFESAVYSSYGEESRNTPIHDLESIGLEPDKLFVGSLLRAQDTKENHYFSNFSRIARAISQLSKPSASIELLVSIVNDTSADIPNRINAWYSLLYVSRYNEDVISEKMVYDILSSISGFELSNRLIPRER